MKTGADAIYKFVFRICGTFGRYAVKLDPFIESAVISGVISPDEAVVVRAFLAGINGLCVIWKKLANFNSIPS